MAVAELKNINSASSNEHLKIGKKREKRGYFAPSNRHQRRTGGRGEAENFFGDSLFYALQHTKIWSNSERSSHKSDWKVKILPIYILILYIYLLYIYKISPRGEDKMADIKKYICIFLSNKRLICG